MVDKANNTQSPTAPLPTGAMYLFSTGALFTTTSKIRLRKQKAPYGASVLVGASGGSFELNVTNFPSKSLNAIAIKPMVEIDFHSPTIALAALLIAPNHPRFRTFRALPPAGVPLPRKTFAHLETLAAAPVRRLTDAEASALFEGIVDAVAQTLPPPSPIDSRVQQVVDLIQANPDSSLDILAESVRLSYYRLSHLFSENLGLPLRNYRTWQRMQKAFELLAEGYTQADIVRQAGFTDVSHFSHACRAVCGMSRSMFFSQRVRIILQGRGG